MDFSQPSSSSLSRETCKSCLHASSLHHKTVRPALTSIPPFLICIPLRKHVFLLRWNQKQRHRPGHLPGSSTRSVNICVGIFWAIKLKNPIYSREICRGGTSSWKSSSKICPAVLFLFYNNACQGFPSHQTDRYHLWTLLKTKLIAWTKR